MAPLTKDQLIQLAAAFGPSLISGIGQGGQAAADRALTEQDRARQAEQELYNRRMGARGGLAGFFQNQLTRDINAAGDFAAQSPLGAEQALARQMARQRAGAEAVRQYKPPTGMSPAASAFAAQQQNFLAPFASADYQATVSPEATARSIAERRKALGAIDPNFQFGSMGDFGLPDLGGEVSQYQGDVRSRRQASEMDLQRLLTEQMREASAAQIPGATSATAAPTTGAATTQKKPSLLRRVVGAALPVAAAFIPGVGPVASALIQAGAGAAGSAIAGGGLKGALTGAAMGGLGAATGGLGSAASRMGAGGAKGGLGSFVQRAILDPRALTQIAGGAIGGGTGAALQAASLGMDRIQGNAGQKLLNQYVGSDGALRQIDPSLLNRPLESVNSTLSAIPGMRVGGELQPNRSTVDALPPTLQSSSQLMAELARLQGAAAPRRPAPRRRASGVAAAVKTPPPSTPPPSPTSIDRDAGGNMPTMTPEMSARIQAFLAGLARDTAGVFYPPFRNR